MVDPVPHRRAGLRAPRRALRFVALATAATSLVAVLCKAWPV